LGIQVDTSNISDLGGELSDHWIGVKVSTIWDFKLQVRHILPTVERDTPVRVAMVLGDR